MTEQREEILNQKRGGKYGDIEASRWRSVCVEDKLWSVDYNLRYYVQLGARNEFKSLDRLCICFKKLILVLVRSVFCFATGLVNEIGEPQRAGGRKA
jgi:hypothetical protein